MEAVLENKYIFWIITAMVAGLFGLVASLLRKRQTDQEQRINKLEADTSRERDRLNDVIAQMPIQYTLRDEFLRVTSDQNRKLDKIGDAMASLSADMSAIKMAVTGGAHHGGDQ